MNKKYLITLQNGETREVLILKHPLFRCKILGEGNDKYLTLEEIKSNNDVIWHHEKDAFRFYMKSIGAIRDENHLFEAYRILQNPIVNLTVATSI